MLEEKIANVIESTKPKASNTLRVLVGAYFPVALGVRRAAEYRADEFRKPTDGSLSEEELAIADKLHIEIISWEATQRLGERQHYFVIKNDDSETRGRIKSLRYVRPQDWEAGRILGYPECCIQECMEDHARGAVPDLRATEHIEYNIKNGIEVNPLTYFAWGFIPCRPNCDEAVKIGSSIYKKYSELSLGIKFKRGGKPTDVHLEEFYKNEIGGEWIRIMALVAEEITKGNWKL
jgi:hypothetical protein